MHQSNLPPIGVFAHKRPAHLREALEAIVASEELLGYQLPIFIFCDAARYEKEREAVQETRAIAHQFERASVIERDQNFGFRNITEGISQLCNSYERAIIIEDDVLISPDFLPFMCAALKKYENEPRVFMASGFMYFNSQKDKPETFFLTTPFIWGWATWKRAWDHFDWECPGWREVVQSKKQRYLYNCLGSSPFSHGLRKTLTGEWKAWGPRWMHAVFKAKGLILYPYRSLAWNCGCGGGTHGDSNLDSDPTLGGREFYIHGTMQREDFKKPRLSKEGYTGQNFPERLVCDKKARRRLAIVFLQERLRQEKRKRWRLYILLFMHKFLHFFD